jgi:hypothetical protein
MVREGAKFASVWAFAHLAGVGTRKRAPMSLNYHEKRKARGMLADKQGVNSIAEELQCEAWEIQELADAKPKAVRRPICTGLLPCLSRPLRAFGLAA